MVFRMQVVFSSRQVKPLFHRETNTDMPLLALSHRIAPTREGLPPAYSPYPPPGHTTPTSRSQARRSKSFSLTAPPLSTCTNLPILRQAPVQMWHLLHQPNPHPRSLTCVPVIWPIMIHLSWKKTSRGPKHPHLPHPLR